MEEVSSAKVGDELTTFNPKSPGCTEQLIDSSTDKKLI